MVGRTFELRENTTEHTSLPSWAFENVFTHLLLTASQTLMSPSFEADTYVRAFGL